MNGTIVISTALGLLLAGTAQAQHAVKRNRPCKADVKTLCPGKKEGGDAMSCLLANLDKIQDATCKARVEKYQTRDNAAKQACSAEIAADNCTDMDIGTGLIKCLDKNRTSLSDACQAALKPEKESEKESGGAPEKPATPPAQ
jgi:hypothetical protein